MQHLIVADVDAVQSYISGSVHLGTMAGASQLVSRARLKITALVEQIDPRGRIVMNEGGLTIVVFPGEPKAGCSGERFARIAEREYTELSVSGHLTVSDPVELATAEGFGEAARNAFVKLDSKKRSGYSAGQLLDVPHAHRCTSCGIEPAIRLQTIGTGDDKDHRWIGQSCLAKREARTRDWLESLLDCAGAGESERADWSMPTQPETFNELAGEHYLGIVLADADGVGQILPLLRTESDWTQFSQGFSKMMASARASILPVFRPALKKPSVLPLQLLYGGGDDVLFACRGDFALEAAHHLTGYPSKDAQDWCPGGKRIGISAGVVICHPGFPFRDSLQIAHGLLHEAKREARERGWRSAGDGAVDYALITEASADVDVIMNDRRILSNDVDQDSDLTLKLTGRPYRVGDRGAESIGTFRSVCRLLAQFPRGRLFALRDMLSVARLMHDHNDFRVSRKWLEEDLRPKLNGWLGAWRKRTCRQQQLRRQWEEVEKQLDLRQGLIKKVSDDLYESPVGDLADGLKLWGIS